MWVRVWARVGMGGFRMRRWRGGGDGDSVLFVCVFGMRRRGRGVWGTRMRLGMGMRMRTGMGLVGKGR